MMYDDDYSDDYDITIDGDILSSELLVTHLTPRHHLVSTNTSTSSDISKGVNVKFRET